MGIRIGLRFAALILFATLVSPDPAAVAEDEGERLFTQKIKPLLKSKCLSCHGADENDLKGDFSVASRAGLLRGGESEDPAVVPGQPYSGTLLDAISWSGLEMPPKEDDRLSEKQIEYFRRWIKLGAPWPSKKR